MEYLKLQANHLRSFQLLQTAINPNKDSWLVKPVTSLRTTQTETNIKQSSHKCIMVLYFKTHLTQLCDKEYCLTEFVANDQYNPISLIRS